MICAMRPKLGPTAMFFLVDRERVRLQLPPLSMTDLGEPLRIHLDFDAASVDEMIERLMELRKHMLPAPRRT